MESRKKNPRKNGPRKSSSLEILLNSEKRNRLFCI